MIDGAAQEAGEHKVFVFRPDDGPTIKLPVDGPGKFHPIYKRLRGRLVGDRITQIQAADCLLVIGGLKNTAEAILTAMALQKPVLAVASYGSAARDAWNYLSPFYERLGGVLGERLGHLREEWLAGNAEIVVQALKALVKSRIFEPNRLIPDLLPFVLNALLFVAWAVLFIALTEHFEGTFVRSFQCQHFLAPASEERSVPSWSRRKKFLEEP